MICYRFAAVLAPVADPKDVFAKLSCGFQLLSDVLQQVLAKFCRIYFGFGGPVNAFVSAFQPGMRANASAS